MNIIVGMDIGGTSIRLGAWRAEQRLAWHAGRELPASAQESLIANSLAEYVRELIRELPETPAAIGVGSCGLIADGVVLQSPNTPWGRLTLVELLENRLKLPVFLLNDADAFLLEAMTRLAAQQCVALGITLGTGVGTALWIRDSLFCGGSGISPEAGHVTLGIDRARANTGVPGSWEMLAGRDALMRYFGEAGGGTAVSPAEIAERARAGDEAAIAAWSRYGRYVGAGLGSLCNVLSPDYVLIGGGMARSSALFEQSMRAALERHMLQAMPRPEIHFIDDEEDAVARGAVRYAQLKLQTRP